MSDEETPVMTVGDLRRHLSLYPDDFELKFEGILQFYRVKQRGPNLVTIEFNGHKHLVE